MRSRHVEPTVHSLEQPPDARVDRAVRRSPGQLVGQAGGEMVVAP